MNVIASVFAILAAVSAQTARLDSLYNDDIVVTNVIGDAGVDTNAVIAISATQITNDVASWALNGSVRPITEHQSLAPATNYTDAVAAGYLPLTMTNSFAQGILTQSGRDCAGKIAALSNNLATVAFTGDYDDLDNLPTIPAEYTDAQAKAQAVAAIAETDTAYTYTNALVALNQSVQYITPNGGTVTLVIPVQTEGRLRDFIVDVYPTADTIVNFAALGHARFTDAAVTNTVKANVFTTFSISESGGGIFKVGRANLEKGW